MKINIDEISEILRLIEELDALDEVRIISGDLDIRVKKAGTKLSPLFTPTSTVATKESKPTPVPTGNNATPGQIKFAKDLVEKVFDNDESAAMDCIAHTLELPLADIPEIETWDTALTRDMVGPIIDTLEKMYRQQRKGKY